MNAIQSLTRGQAVTFKSGDKELAGIVLNEHPHSMLMSKKYWVRTTDGERLPVFFHALLGS